MGTIVLIPQSWLQDGKGGGEGFEVQKYGDGRVALIGESATLIVASFAVLLNMVVQLASGGNVLVIT